MLDSTEQKLVCDFLVSAALADHLGDIRDAEGKLWQLLGVERDELRKVRSEVDYDVYQLLRVLADKHNLPVPGYVLSDE